MFVPFKAPWNLGYTHPPFWTWASRVGNTEEVGMGRGRLEAEKREETLVLMAHRSWAIRKSL